VRSDVRALLRPLMKTVRLLSTVALGVVGCLLVLLVMMGEATRGQGNDAGILDLRWKIEWGYY
jgi:hypothetical protein